MIKLMRMSYTCTKSVIKILKVEHLDVRNSFMLNTVTLVLIVPQKITTNNKTKRPYRKKEKVFVTYVY